MNSVVEMIEREYWPLWMTVFVVFAALLIIATWAAILACVL